jgi:hypothetical protein
MIQGRWCMFWMGDKFEKRFVDYVEVSNAVEPSWKK